MGKGADVGVGRKTARKRAVGTREHIIAYLTEINELFDANGMASTQLAAAVGYPGSSVAFAQLLSGMERSGLIEREVRGKRTYRINLGPAHAIGSGVAARASGTGSLRLRWLSGSAGLLGLAGPAELAVRSAAASERLASITTNWPAACWSRSSGGWPRPSRRRATRTVRPRIG